MTLSQVERRLAAILVADVVGYSRQVEADEARTLAALKDLRQTVLEPLLAEHGGRLVKLLGDGLIAEFGSVVGAVACAAAIQAQVAGRQEQVPPERRIILRIGVNLGDVVIEGDDLLGDGVNIAARLEQICEPGGVMISGAAYDQLPGKLDVRFAYAGEPRLKNIARPVRTYRLMPEGRLSQLDPAPRASEKPVIAVLPFHNLSGDPEQVYFSDGMTEEVLTELSRFRELMVIARNSSFAFRGKSMDVREIGHALGATYVIEGNVRRAGNRVRINAQLVDSASGTHLWAERYDRAIEGVFAVQEEIAQSIVATVAQRVRDEGEVAARRRPPEDIRAYDLFLKGLRLSDTFTPEVQAQVEALYEQARAIDPTFARTYTGLAYIHLNRSINVVAGVGPQPDEHRFSALDLAERALALDPNDPQVHCTLGMMCAFVRDFDRGERHFDLARTMNPNDASIQILWAWMQAVTGKPERGMAAAETAYRLNPRHPLWYDRFVARLHFQLGHYGEATALLERSILGIPARRLRDTGWLVAALAHQARLDEAARRGEELVREIACHWRGDPGAGPSDYVDWIVWSSLLQHAADIERLRVGLRLARLPSCTGPVPGN
jgi:adenylate cyclase